MSCDKTSVDLDISIRPALLDDLDELRTLDHKVFGELAYPPFVLRQMFDVYQAGWLVAENPSGGLAGYSLGAPTLDRKLAWLLGLAVAPECRNLGIGERLTLRSLELLRSAGVPKVYLTVEPGNEAAIGLYRRVGFEVTERRRDYFGPGEDRIIMFRPLAGSAGAQLGAANTIPAPRPNSGVREF